MQESHLQPAQSKRYIYTSVCTTNRKENKGLRVDKRMEKTEAANKGYHELGLEATTRDSHQCREWHIF